MAVIAIVLAVLSLPSFLFTPFLPLALLGTIFGALSIRSIRNLPRELTGMPFALSGCFVSLGTLVGATSLHTYVYLTEVPDGYQRIRFTDLRPKSMRNRGKVPAKVRDLDGKRIFVKGYVHPGVDGKGNIRKFVLVGDLGTCCFGGQPNPTDMIEVTLVGDHRLQYSMSKRNLGGVLEVVDRLRSAPGGLNGGYYKLVADYLK